MRTVKISEVCDLKNGINFEKTYIKNPCKILGVADFKDRYYADYSQLDVVDGTVLKAEDYLQNKDIVFVRSNGNKTLVGRSLYIDNLTEKVTFSGFCIRLRVTSPDVNPKYLYYLSKTKLFKAKFGKTQQTNINNLSQDVLKNIEIELPPYYVQESVVQIIDSYTQKILNNTAICSDLEAMAKLLYDYWFVQFDFPNENGKPYKSSGGKMVWNEELKREIPEGWEVTTVQALSNMFVDKREASFGKDIGKYRFYSCSKSVQYCDEYDYDGKSIIVANHGEFRAEHIDGKFSAYFCNTILQPKNDVHYGLLFFSLNRYMPILQRQASGSIVKFISNSEIGAVPIVIPDVDFYSRIFNSILEQSEQIFEENQRLASLRDFLLPMLMNGQVKIKGSKN